MRMRIKGLGTAVLGAAEFRVDSPYRAQAHPPCISVKALSSIGCALLVRPWRGTAVQPVLAQWVSRRGASMNSQMVEPRIGCAHPSPYCLSLLAHGWRRLDMAARPTTASRHIRAVLLCEAWLRKPCHEPCLGPKVTA